MNDDLRLLATRALASKHWQYKRGMLLRAPRTCYAGEGTYCEWWCPIRLISEIHPEDGDDYPAIYVLDGDILRDCDGLDVWLADADGALPDFSDAGTLGCLLALVQEAHGALVWLAPETEPDPLDDSSHVPVTETPSWLVWIARDGDYIDVIGHGPTQTAALVAALEAAP